MTVKKAGLFRYAMVYKGKYSCKPLDWIIQDEDSRWTTKVARVTVVPAMRGD